LGSAFTSEEELDKTMKLLDLNKDGKISLDEFNTWWIHGKTNKLEELVWLRMKSLRL
jgi:Ca2+-binding EF-hand superfamily protein